MSRRVVVESPCSGKDEAEFQKHMLYLLWACRDLVMIGRDPIASHLVGPWFLDDTVPAERLRGIESEWFWLGDPHYFFLDLGMSPGMRLACDRCLKTGVKVVEKNLTKKSFEQYLQGIFPPHTPGFVLGT
jgi:hypothetical protein